MLVARLFSGENVSPEELRNIRKMLDERLEEMIPSPLSPLPREEGGGRN